MPVDRAGKRATRIAKAAVSVTWWAGVGLSVFLVAAFFGAPLLEGSGYAACFDWNAFHVEHRAGPPAVALRVSVSNDSEATPLKTRDAMRASDPKLEDTEEARLEFRTRQWGFFYAVNWTVLPLFGAVLFGLYSLRSFLAGVLAGDVFTKPNATRLSWLGWLLIVVDVAGTQMEYWRGWAILRHIQLSGADLSPATGEQHGLWLLGVLVLVLAAAWRYGAELQEDRDLTA